LIDLHFVSSVWYKVFPKTPLKISNNIAKKIEENLVIEGALIDKKLPQWTYSLPDTITKV